VPAQAMFESTFNGCSSMPTIPANLFSKVVGAVKQRMFYATFEACASLTTLPSGLFPSITKSATSSDMNNVFSRTFFDCLKVSTIATGGTSLINSSGQFTSITIANCFQLMFANLGDNAGSITINNGISTVYIFGTQLGSVYTGGSSNSAFSGSGWKNKFSGYTANIPSTWR
jgi:hypothetical protein